MDMRFSVGLLWRGPVLAAAAWMLTACATEMGEVQAPPASPIASPAPAPPPPLPAEVTPSHRLLRRRPRPPPPTPPPAVASPPLAPPAPLGASRAKVPSKSRGWRLGLRGPAGWPRW